MSMRVKTEIEGKTKDVALLDVTKENFIVPKGEERCYHCRIEVVKFNGETGERLSKPRIQVFGKKFFETFGLHNLKKQGYKVDILHDPNVWEAENKEKTEEAKRAKAEAAAKAEEEAKAAEREQLKKEIMAELAANGLISTEPKAEETAEPKKRGRKPKAEETAESATEGAEDSKEV